MAKPSPGLQKRGRVWWIDKQVNGIRILESTRTPRLEEAEEILRRKVARLSGLPQYCRPEEKFIDGAIKYLEESSHASIGRDVHAIQLLEPYIGDLRMIDVDNDALSEYKRKRLAGLIPAPGIDKDGKPKRPRPRSAGTVNRDLACVRRILNLSARVWRWIPSAPLIQEVKGPSKKPYPLQWAEQDALFAALPAHLQDACYFDVNTGLRESELCGLRWDMEVELPELDTSGFILPVTKNGEERIVVLNSVAKKAIERCRGNHRTWVFTYRDERLKGIENTAWRRAWRKAGLPTDPMILKGVHNLRHTFGHRLRAYGVPIEDRKALLGHTTGDITTHYSMPDIARMIEYVERLTKRKETTVLRPTSHAKVTQIA